MICLMYIWYNAYFQVVNAWYNGPVTGRFGCFSFAMFGMLGGLAQVSLTFKKCLEDLLRFFLNAWRTCSGQLPLKMAWRTCSGFWPKIDWDNVYCRFGRWPWYPTSDTKKSRIRHLLMNIFDPKIDLNNFVADLDVDLDLLREIPHLSVLREEALTQTGLT